MIGHFAPLRSRLRQRFSVITDRTSLGGLAERISVGPAGRCPCRHHGPGRTPIPREPRLPWVSAARAQMNAPAQSMLRPKSAWFDGRWSRSPRCRKLSLQRPPICTLQRSGWRLPSFHGSSPREI
jgi:hypothetical protein